MLAIMNHIAMSQVLWELLFLSYMYIKQKEEFTRGLKRKKIYCEIDFEKHGLTSNHIYQTKIIKQNLTKKLISTNASWSTVFWKYQTISIWIPLKRAEATINYLSIIIYKKCFSKVIAIKDTHSNAVDWIVNIFSSLWFQSRNNIKVIYTHQSGTTIDMPQICNGMSFVLQFWDVKII